MKNDTIAEEIAQQFNNDHMQEVNAKGENIRMVCSQEASTRETNPELELVKYVFPDDSCITLSPNGGWDIGFTACWCWQGEGCTCHKDTHWCHGCGDE